MKHRIHYLMSGIITLATFSALPAAEEPKTGGKEPRKEMRVVSPPERERRMMVRRPENAEIEKEMVAFLGVETGPVSPAVSTQLGLQRGTGLVVNHIVPDSPAAGALQQHDILLKLDDQILIETRQLSVLIRNKKEGDEVTLTYLRGGKQTTARVKLGQQEVPKFSLMGEPGEGAFALGLGPNRLEMLAPRGPGNREEVDRLLSIMPRAPGDPMRIHIDRRGGQGLRAMSVNPGNSNLVFSDDEGSLELTIKDGAKALVAKDAKGAELFSGPVNTPEERKAMPPRIRERLEKLEGMHGVTFRTDGDFRGGEVKAIRPRGISFPLSRDREGEPVSRRLPAFF